MHLPKFMTQKHKMLGNALSYKTTVEKPIVFFVSLSGRQLSVTLPALVKVLPFLKRPSAHVPGQWLAGLSLATQCNITSNFFPPPKLQPLSLFTGDGVWKKGA